MSENTISIALTTCNSEPFLWDQLLSIAEQTRLPDELIVCDDVSKDNTLKILEQFRQSVPFSVEIYQNEKRLGATKNFEKAISLCNGNMIALCDHDDVWLPCKLEKLENVLKDNPEAGYVFSDAIVVDEKLNPLGYNMWEFNYFNKKIRRQFINQEHQFSLLLKRNYIQGATMLFREDLRKYVLPIPEEWIQDAWIAIISTIIGRKGVYVEEPLIKYRQHANQVTGAHRESFFIKAKRSITEHEKICKEIIIKLSLLKARIELINNSYLAILNEIEHFIYFLELRRNLSKYSLFKGFKLICEALSKNYYMRYYTDWRSPFKDLLIIFVHNHDKEKIK